MVKATVGTVTDLSVVPSQPEPLAEWLEPSLLDTAGRDPLGLNTITLDRVLPQLIPGILQLSERARYFSIYPWMLWQFAQRKRPATKDELDHFIRRREYELCLAMKLCPHCDAFKAIGGNSAGPRVNAGDDPFERGLSVKSDKGGFGLYYRGPLAEMGAVAPVGTPLGTDGKPTPIEVLLKTGRATALAESFHASIEYTEYYRRYERTDASIPREVLEELAEAVCLCRLKHRPEERNAVRALMFTAPAAEAAEACEARRRAFALFLSLLAGDGRVALEDGEFWRGLISRFLAAPTGEDVESTTTAAWAALAMKECTQDALCSIWTDFCRSGVRRSDLVGLSRSELDEMIHGLADGTDLRLGDTDLSVLAEESSLRVQERAVVAADQMDWEDLRAWAAEADSAIAGLVALIVLAGRIPEPGAVHPAWGEISRRHSEHQDGLLGTLSLISGRLRSEPTVAELLNWTIQRFLIGPHEAIAYSKLPNATFRFYWEETGRMRFFSPGSGGLGRFEPSDDRRGPMASLTEDIGFWGEGNGGGPELSEDGRTFVSEVLG